MSDLVAHPEDRFSCDEAHYFIMEVEKSSKNRIQGPIQWFLHACLKEHKLYNDKVPFLMRLL